MEVPPGYRLVGSSALPTIVREDLVDVADEVWWSEGQPLADAAGRGGVGVLELPDGTRGVARDFLRGGAMRGLRTRFLDRTRAVRELVALAGLRGRGVPALEPIAALCRRQGLFYRMRLVTVLIEEARPLPAFVAGVSEQARAAVREAGRVVRAAFDAGLVHPDLHPDNLLGACRNTSVTVWVMDLDRAEIRDEVLVAERTRMLLRMARYLERHVATLPVRVRAVDKLRFLAGMGLDRDERRSEWRRLEEAYERAVARHRVAWKAR